MVNVPKIEQLILISDRKLTKYFKEVTNFAKGFKIASFFKCVTFLEENLKCVVSVLCLNFLKQLPLHMLGNAAKFNKLLVKNNVKLACLT